MHTWVRKGIALAVSGVLTVGMAASLPFGSLADFSGRMRRFGRCNHLDGYLWAAISGVFRQRFLLPDW